LDIPRLRGDVQQLAANGASDLVTVWPRLIDSKNIHRVQG
jgi:hypothetical protein